MKSYRTLIRELSESIEAGKSALDIAGIQKKRDILIEQVATEVKSGFYSLLPKSKILGVIAESGGNESLADEYLALAESKELTKDPVVLNIRRLNPFDMVLEGKIHFKLEDGTDVLVSSDTLENIE